MLIYHELKGNREGLQHENEIRSSIRYNFLRIRDKNVNFVLCDFKIENMFLLIQLKPLKLT